MPDFSQARDRIVDRHIAKGGVRNRKVFWAIRNVPREAFVDVGFEEFVYEDVPLPIGEGHTISQPYIVARRIAAGEVKPGDRVLEVGAGSGCAAAVPSRIPKRVHAIEQQDALGKAAAARLKKLCYVEVRIGGGTKGWPEAAPFDVILVTISGPVPPQAHKDQLDPGLSANIVAVAHRKPIVLEYANDTRRLGRLERGRFSLEQRSLATCWPAASRSRAAQ